MNSTKCFRSAHTLLLTLLLTLSIAASAAQGQKKPKDKKDEPPPQGTPVLWKEPTDIATRDLINGNVAEDMKPDLSQVTFEADETRGYSVKWHVKDGAGKKWVVKLGNEARPETAAARLVWAVGYMTDVDYLVPCVQIVNAPKPRKKVEQCEGKGFANVRFEARPKGWKRVGNWSWMDNPFKGTKEFQGLVIMMALLNNWDLKDTNNTIVYVPGEGGGQGELQYVVSDLGATFGKTGGPIAHSRNEPEKYVKTGFVERVEGGRVKFAYHGKNGGLFDSITVEQAKWIGDLLSQLSEQQISDAFRAANFTPEEVAALTAQVRERIDKLAKLPAPATPASTGSGS